MNQSPKKPAENKLLLSNNSSCVTLLTLSAAESKWQVSAPFTFYVNQWDDCILSKKMSSYMCYIWFSVCGGQLRSFPGSFSTPHYPKPYPDDRKCLWDIVAPKGLYIYVKFHGTYHLEVQCFFGECVCKDTLDIKDGDKDLPYPPHDG